VQRGQAEKDAISWCVMTWDWYYSPHLNPDEQVWAHVKRRVSKQSVKAKDDMKKLALGALRRIQKLPRLVRAFFQPPECKYASQ
jgi:hypothetical protein